MLITEIYATSHIGRVRRGNEDNYLLLNISASSDLTASQDSDEFTIRSQKVEIDDNGLILAVSDGMGGALAGEVASRLAVETVSSRILNDDPDAAVRSNDTESLLIERLYDATVYANHLIHYQGRTDPQFSGMGATFTGVAITPEAVDIIQVGDSRAYVVRNARIFQVTKDQSLVQQLIDSNQLSPEHAESHPMKNVILQALGAQNEVYPVPARLRPCRDDILLLCSDGLSNKLPAADLLRIILDNSDQLETACRQLVAEANERGGEDNITLILAKLSGSSLEEPCGENLTIEPLNFGNIHDTQDQDTAERFEDN